MAGEFTLARRAAGARARRGDTLATLPALGKRPLRRSLTYRDAGVDIDAGEELVRRIGPACARTRRPEVLGGIGGFGALATLPTRYREPVLVTGTDGVGTKLKLAIDHDRHDTVGQDLVAMCANDVLVTGAEPFLFLDYYATSSLDVDVAERVIVGIAEGCTLAGCALVGGETAEMPGFYAPGDYDLAGFCVGVVERARIVDGRGVVPGTRLIGLPSSGPHSNGYSLIRRILDETVDRPSPELLAELLAPTRIYAGAVLPVARALDVAGMAHITGGGILENLPRMFARDDVAARIDLDAWKRPGVFGWIAQSGNVAEREMLRTFNCGIGFVLCVAAGDVDRTLEMLRGAGEVPALIGEIVPLTGARPRSGELVLGADGSQLFG
jgi:phosphoribosylformylglycinamidine cyclo-ligase